MRISKEFLVAATLFSSILLLVLSVNSQTTNPIINSGVNGVFEMNRLRILGGNEAMARSGENGSRVAEIKRIGAAKIKAGKATTDFSASAAATETLAQSISWESTEPQELAGQVQYIQRYVQQFEILMRKNGYKPKDYVDGYAFAVALSFAAYNNKNPNDAEIQEFRKNQRELILNDQLFQGVNDARKQYLYEQNALMAMQAAEYRINARRATTEKDRKYWDAKAKHYGGFLLDTK